MLNSYSDYNTGDAVGKRHTVNAPMSSETNKRFIYSWSVFHCLQLVHLELQAVVKLSVGKVVPGVKYVFVMSCFVLKVRRSLGTLSPSKYGDSCVSL